MMDSALLLAEDMASAVRDGRLVKSRRRNEMIAVFEGEKQGDVECLYDMVDILVSGAKGQSGRI